MHKSTYAKYFSANRNIFKSVFKIPTMEASDWKGVPITHIQGSQSPWGSPEFPLVQPAYNHSVLYHIPSNGALLDRPPKPQIGKDKWDHDHVRLPCSTHNLYPVENSAEETHLMSRWEMIQNALNKPIRNSNELTKAILSYNTQFKNKWKFRSLHKLFNDYLEDDETKYFFDVTLPEIAKLALALPKLIQSPIPLLKQNKNKSLSLSQQQVACLLANAFFCTFPRRNTMKRNSEYASYPHINFNGLYECSPADSIMEKLKCICHYFRRVCTKAPAGVLTLRRRAARARDWRACARALGALPVHVHAAHTIEDAGGLVQVDFANKYLGGGVLGHGCVQEEIRFMICPELLITLLVCEVMKPNEAVMVIGCERYSNYTGYASGFQWAGDFEDATPFDSSGRRRCAVLAIDAISYVSKFQEFRPESIDRELNKAWVGFSCYTDEDCGEEVADASSAVTLQYPGIATGNWGCGVFGGSPELKWLIQLMAATRAGRPLAYYTFGDARLRDSIAAARALLVNHDVTVGQLYEYIMKYSKMDILKTNLNTFLEQVLTGQEPKNDSLCMNVDTEYEELPVYVEQLLNESPDMFSQDEESPVTPRVSLLDVTTDNNLSLQNQYKENVDKITRDKTNENKITGDKTVRDETVRDKTVRDKTVRDKTVKDETVRDKTVKDETVRDETPNTSRLFEEMEKLDEESGKLNLKSPQKLFFSEHRRVSNGACEEKIQIEITSEVKKKITKKITDYFAKKPA